MAQVQNPILQYRALMTNVRARHELVSGLGLTHNSAFVDFETAAFHLRKTIEGVAFGCLIAIENGLKKIPRDAQGQWNADKIFTKLKKQEKLVFPESFLRTDPGADTPPGIQHHIIPQPEANLSVDDVRHMYRRLHVWNHEWNPYVEEHGKDFEKRKAEVLVFGPKLWNWLLRHMIGVGGEVILAHLKEGEDGKITIVSATSNHGLSL